MQAGLEPAPRLPEILRAALAQLKAGGFAAAARLVEPLYHARPDDVDVLMLLGLAVAGSGHPDLAADLLDDVARRRPEAAHPARDLLPLLDAAGRADGITAYLDAALALAPADARLLLAAGTWMQETGRSTPAVALLERAVAVAPGSRAARINLAAALADCGQLDVAIAQLRGLLAGGDAFEAFANLGAMLGVERRYAEALSCFEQARRLAPRHVQMAVNHGIVLLKSGRLAQGWPSFNRRLELPGHMLLPPAAMLPPLAPGADLAGKIVLVTHDSGFGDTLQFARYLPLLAATGATVLLWVPEPLRRLLAAMPGIAGIFSDRRAWPAFDWHCPVVRLAEVFHTRIETIPGSAAYLQADPALAANWAERLPPPAGRRRVGLVWAGSARDSNPQLAAIDRRRSIDPSLLRPLLDLPDVCWVSLQKGRPWPECTICDPMPEVADFADTAAIVASLDAVVSVDTSVAHLAGGMGVPVHLLDRYDNCWRWLSDREDSPWYSGLRIYRQPAWNDWETPIRQLAAVLR